MMKTKCIPLVAAISALCLMWGCSQSNSQAGHDVSQESPGTVQTENRNAVELVSNITTTQYFTDDKVSNDDIETILMAGINTPSAMNGQPWHFSVITDAALLQQISEDMSSGMRVGRGTPPDGADMPDGKLPEYGELPAYGELPEYGELPDGFDADGDRDSSPPPDTTAGGNHAATGSVLKAGIADAPLVIVVSCSDGSELDAGLACQTMSVAAQLLGYGTKIISSPTLAVNGENQAAYREHLGIPENQAAAAFLLIGMEDTSMDENADAYTSATPRNPLDEMVTYVEGQ